MKVEFKILDGKLPEKQTSGSAGYDLFSALDCVIPAKKVKLVRLGFAMAIEPGFEAQIRSRSGLALNHNIFVLNSPGTIDYDYRNEIAVILCNFSDIDFFVKKEDRIAQMVFSKLWDVEMILVDDLFKTSRLDGFGSTGL